MAYTSDQYKYLLFRRLQRHFSMADPVERCYTQNFFGELFDETIIITEEQYMQFVNAMDTEMQYCADHNVYEAEDISDSMIESEQHLLIEAFAAVNITLVIEIIKNDNGTKIGGDATFTKPNGDVMVYSVREGQNEFTINSMARTEYNYAKLSAPYYNFEDCEIYDIDDYNPMSAGIMTYWSYNEDTATMTVTGEGTYITCPRDTQIGGGDYSTLILGANVSRIAAGSLADAKLKTLVLLHPTEAELILEEGITNSTDCWTIDVYCDNEVFRNYEGFAPGLVIKWHALNEWDGGASTTVKHGVYYNGIFAPEFSNPTNNPYLMLGVTSDGKYIIHPYSSARTIADDATTLSAYGGLWSSVSNYELQTDDWYWKKYNQQYTITPKWANYDVKNESGTVVLAASTPTTTN